MEPKSGKPLRVFNPLAIWTDITLKSGTAMLEAAQAAVTRPRPKVAVIPAQDASPPKAAPTKASKAKPKTSRKNASSRARRRGR